MGDKLRKCKKIKIKMSDLIEKMTGEKDPHHCVVKRNKNSSNIYRIIIDYCVSYK